MAKCGVVFAIVLAACGWVTGCASWEPHPVLAVTIEAFSGGRYRLAVTNVSGRKVAVPMVQGFDGGGDDAARAGASQGDSEPSNIEVVSTTYNNLPWVMCKRRNDLPHFYQVRGDEIMAVFMPPIGQADRFMEIWPIVATNWEVYVLSPNETVTATFAVRDQLVVPTSLLAMTSDTKYDELIRTYGRGIFQMEAPLPPRWLFAAVPYVVLKEGATERGRQSHFNEYSTADKDEIVEGLLWTIYGAFNSDCESSFTRFRVATSDRLALPAALSQSIVARLRASAAMAQKLVKEENEAGGVATP